MYALIQFFVRGEGPSILRKNYLELWNLFSDIREIDNLHTYNTVETQGDENAYSLIFVYI